MFFFFKHKVRFICPACGNVSKLDRDFVRANEETLNPGPEQPPQVECHWCHEGLAVPFRYRLRNGKVYCFGRALRARPKNGLF